MRKFIMFIMIAFALTITSCVFVQNEESTSVDSTQTDSVSIDSVAIDTPQIKTIE